MSTGESDYAKRVVELSMQLANSRADVENLRMRIKAVDKEHEQLKKDRADMVDRFDAALRRAKADGMRAAIDGATSLKASVANGIPPHERVGFVRACNELIGYAKARAAQIEEGA